MATRKTTGTSTSRASVIETDSPNFIKAYQDSYSYLYNSDGRRSAREQARYNRAVDEFDYKLQTDPKFAAGVRRFCMARQDGVSSEREAAAYVYAYNAAKRKASPKRK